MKSLTIAFVTSRVEPKFQWFFDSLSKQLSADEKLNIIVVDHWAKSEGRFENYLDEAFFGAFSAFKNENVELRHVSPKPSVWQGPSRLTSCDWWAKSSALNSSIALCETEWWAWVDDRAVLGPHWLQSVREAMDGNYAVCGSYEKWANLYVKDGSTDTGGDFLQGQMLGGDTRTPGLYDFDSWYGGSGALPLEWCLAVQGFSEDFCDGLGSEDSMFGVTLRNNGFPVKYDSRMKIIEDRTPGQIDGALKRADKGVSPNDKSHAIVERFQNARTSMNSYDIRELRAKVLAGEPWPAPTASGQDWFDGQFLRDME